jgi:hypothetical protein
MMKFNSIIMVATKKIVKNILTGRDNETFDIARVMWGFSVLVFLGITVASFIRGDSWHPYETAQGIAWILFGGGASVAVKGNTEPGG